MIEIYLHNVMSIKKGNNQLRKIKILGRSAGSSNIGRAS